MAFLAAIFASLDDPGTSLYRIPSLDGGPGITIPPAALKEAQA